MTKEDFIRKITSRKFWITILGNVIGVCSLLTASPNAEIQMVASIILIVCTNVTYILGESKIDAMSAAKKALETIEELKKIVDSYKTSQEESLNIEEIDGSEDK